MNRPSRAVKSFAVVLLAFAPFVVGARAEAQEVSGEEVQRAIRRGIAYLKSRQRADGHWPQLGNYPGGTTALSLVALLNAGLPREDAAIRRGIHAILGQGDQQTYVVALKIMALAMDDPKGHAREIQLSANWLVGAQLGNGAWTYMRSTRSAGDHSNTQFALLGLHAAAQAGASVEAIVWRKAETHWETFQIKDGGWGYSAGTKKTASTHSMTAAGIASLYIVGETLSTGRERGFKDGRAPNCGKYGQNKAIAAGLAWLGRRFVAQPVGAGGAVASMRHLYYLYAVERVGMLTGLTRIGNHDWYREGAAYLVSAQQANGSWADQDVTTSFALLFLGKGHRSILVNKLRWTSDDGWQRDRNDMAHVTAWLGDKLGQPVTWQVVDLDDPMERWLEAPILYFTGHRFPRFREEEVRKLRKFVELGGTIVAEACCGTKAFVDGFRAFAAEGFGEWPLRPLDPDHPLYNSMYELKQGDFELEGIDLGCRTSVIFSPRDLSCLWEQGDIPILSERAFQMGANIAAYATGRETLRDRLAVVHMPEGGGAPRRSVLSGVQIGQVIHKGGWRPAPLALPNLAGFLSERANVDVVTRAVPIKLDDASLFEHPILYMAGQFDFALSQAEKENLRKYLERGGFLFADACCGRKPFDVAFRRLMAEVFAPDALQPLPSTHPILSGQIGYDVSKVEYQLVLQREQPDLHKPVLDGVELNGRTAVVYSRYDIGCALEGSKCSYCRGYSGRDAERIATNIVLYALSF
ncbi:MAG: DUF4159 domain-containing protein [Phycisphaerae bacterium]|nr:DUF4159 domain-containing protein [Phycisphaerae bacterium]